MMIDFGNGMVISGCLKEVQLFIPVKGDTGLTGDDGPEGPQGQPGPRGSQGIQGFQGPGWYWSEFSWCKKQCQDLPASGDHEYGDSWVIENPAGYTEPRVYTWVGKWKMV